MMFERLSTFARRYTDRSSPARGEALQPRRRIYKARFKRCSVEMIKRFFFHIRRHGRHAIVFAAKDAREACRFLPAVVYLHASSIRTHAAL